MIGDVARYADRAFRIGGDEFAILMPHTDAEGAMQIAHRLLERAHAATRGTAGRSRSRAASRPVRSTRRRAPSCTPRPTPRCTGASATAARRSMSSTRCATEPPARRRPTSSRRRSPGSSTSASCAPSTSRSSTSDTGRVIGFEGLSRPMPESGFADPGSHVHCGGDGRPDGRARPRLSAGRRRRRRDDARAISC